MFDLIAFDADDTLWENEALYAWAQEQLRSLLGSYGQPQEIDQKLNEIESGNLDSYGYGFKSFGLSMIETAIDLSGGGITGKEIQQIIRLLKEMLRAEVHLLDGALEVVQTLSTQYDLMLITKGDLLDQQRKIKRSGLGGYFKYIEIVSEKDAHSYKKLLEKYQIDPHRFLMVGNSLRSDILPVIALGGKAIYIPYHLTWKHEIPGDLVPGENSYYQIEHLGEIPSLMARLLNS